MVEDVGILCANIMFGDTVVTVKLHSSTVGDVTQREKMNCCICNNTAERMNFIKWPI